MNDHNAESSRAEAVAGLRAHVNSLLSAGTPPADVSFALAYVATELGLHVMAKSAPVLHVVLQGVVAATHAHEETADVDANSETGDEQATAERPLGIALH